MARKVATPPEAPLEDKYIGMGDAMKILKVSDHKNAKQVLTRHNVELTKVNERAYIVKESEVRRVAQERGGQVLVGRPSKDGTQRVKVETDAD